MTFKKLLLMAALALPAAPCAAETWYWADAQCRNEEEDEVYVFFALVQTESEGQEGFDDARFGFGNFAEDEYAEEYCGVAEITAQNMDSTGEFASREEADESLTDYLERTEDDLLPSIHHIRVDDYIDED